MNAYRKPPASVPKPSPADCWRWLSPDDVVRHALAAYYRAQRNATPPKGYPPQCLEPEGWSNPAEFLATLLNFFELRLRSQAHHVGLPGFDLAHAEQERIAALPDFCDLHVSEVDPELWQQIQRGSVA